MNKIFISISLLPLFLLNTGCKNAAKKEDNNAEKQVAESINYTPKSAVKDSLSKYIPDSTINNKLIFDDDNSTEKFYPDYKKLSYYDITAFSHPFILFVNKNISQYLIAYTYEGGTVNAFDCFETGYYKENKKLDTLKYYRTNEQHFKTESDLGLGSSFEEIINKKGTGCKKAQIGNDLLIKYEIKDTSVSPFLQRYCMPSYFEKFYLRNNKAYKIIFGFGYP